MCHIKVSFWDEKEANRLFQELPFYNALIEKPRIKRVKNIDLLHELPFYDELSVVKISKAFKRYTRSYKIEIIDPKDPLAQLEAIKLTIEDLFKNLLDEIKGFKCQIIVNVLLSKYKENGGTEFAPVYFNYTAKTMINLNMILANPFKKICRGLIIGLIKDLVG